MPLHWGKSDKMIGKNIEKLVGEGYKRSQAIAIALDHAGVARKFDDKTANRPGGIK